MAEIVLALDLPDRSAALAMLARVPAARWVKVGPVLFTGAGPELVTVLVARGHAVFLDLKWHDIPNTVAGAVRRARELGVLMVTVHTLGGGEMMAAARDAAGDDLAVVGVTVLTSHDAETFGAVLGRPVASPAGEVLRLAGMARGAGLHGVVSSPLETAALRTALGPEALLVTPGIRAPDEARGDQLRTATAAEAVRAGSTHLVVGRPVLLAADPAAVWARLAAETSP